MKCTRFQKPNKKDGAEYGLYLTHDDRRKLIDATKHMIEQLTMEGLQSYDLPHVKLLERVLAELEVPT